jgi:hypothetical protein
LVFLIVSVGLLLEKILAIKTEVFKRILKPTVKMKIKRITIKKIIK